MEIITVMCKLFLAMGIGFLLFKKNLLTVETNAKLSTVLVRYCIPCVIINSVSSVPHNNSKMIIRLLIAGLLAYMIYLAIGYLFTALFHVPKYLKGTYICMLVFANSIFMGYPVVQAMFGDVAIFYITIFNMPFNILFFLLGPYYFRKDSAMENPSDMKANQKIPWQEIFNGGLIASVIALIIYFGNFPLPEIIYSCVGFIGGISTPMSMILIGSSLAALSLRKMLGEKKVWPMIPFRLVIIPCIVWLFMHLFTKDSSLIAICTIGSGMPVASIVAMGSNGMPRQNQIATVGVAISTICSIISIPMMIMILNRI